MSLRLAGWLAGHLKLYQTFHVLVEQIDMYSNYEVTGQVLWCITNSSTCAVQIGFFVAHHSHHPGLTHEYGSRY